MTIPTTISEVRAELERLDKLATPGPWEKSEPDYFGDFSIRRKGKALAIAVIVNGAINELSGHGDEHRANADLVILIRNNLPAFIEAADLLSAAEAREGVLREQLRALSVALEPFKREFDDMGLGQHLRNEQLMLDVDCGGEILTVGHWRMLMGALDAARKALGGPDGQH